MPDTCSDTPGSEGEWMTIKFTKCSGMPWQPGVMSGSFNYQLYLHLRQVTLILFCLCVPLAEAGICSSKLQLVSTQLLLS